MEWSLHQAHWWFIISEVILIRPVKELDHLFHINLKMLIY